ncbi:TVP38/TMEM64 family protein [Propionivibrio soli]|uniref:TVP38/TMEM64 family protein n=1 Tax=Propionivibrio soli TaxID=2976531 RepID=UPI0021E81529|nr:TVP38/TMEM64 family protein [Propionivibrio soli]
MNAKAVAFRSLAVILLVGLVLAWVILFLGSPVDFADVKSRQADLVAWVNQHPLSAPVTFFVAYTVFSALSIPGGAVMTLLGGALFGVGWGVLLISFASTLGATIAFLASRHGLRRLFEHRFALRLRGINAGIEKDGAFYLFSLRLVPVFPFFLVNVLLGLTRMRLRTYYWVSQLGMLPGTIIYANAGERLAELASPSDILSPATLASLALIGLLPLLLHKGLAVVRKRRRLRQRG